MSDFQTSQRLAVTYRELITVLSMLEEVAAALEIPYSAKQLTGMVEASLIPNTQLLWVKARNSNPEHAALIANTLAERFIDRRQEDFLAELERLTVAAEARGLLNSQEILDAQLIALQSLNNILESLASSPSTSEELVETQVSTLQGLVSALNTLGDLASAQDLFGAQLSTLGNLSIVEFAPVPDSARSSALTTAIFALILIGLVPIPAVFLMEYFSDRIRTSEQVEKTFHLTSLGTVSRWQEKLVAEDGLVVAHHSHSRVAEMFREVRANFQFSVAAQPGKAFMFTSLDSGGGNTTVLANLGIALAQDGARVVLVDGDLRHPTLHQRFRLPNTIGLSSLLKSGDGLSDTTVQSSFVEGLHVLTGGPVPPNPAELLGSHKMQTVIEALEERFDIVLLDSSPLGAVVDPIVLARKVDGVVLVAVANGTKINRFRDSLKKLQPAGALILGVLLNKAPARRTDKIDRAYLPGEQGEEFGDVSDDKKRPKATSPSGPATGA